MIGGDFELLPEMVRSRAPHTSPRDFFAAGRGALFAILLDALRRFGITSVLLPDYVCTSVINCVQDAGLAYRYYRVGMDLLPDAPALLAASASEGGRCAIVLIDYFGLTGTPLSAGALDALGASAVLILDRSHAPYSEELPPGVEYAFATLRKAFPVVDGAFAVSRDGRLRPASDEEAPFVAEKVQAALIKARAEAEGLPDESFLVHGRAGERMLDGESFYDNRMSETSAAILDAADTDAIRARRRDNFGLLESLLEPLGIRPIRALAEDRTPLFLPVLLRNRDETRRVLAERRIFCPVHWPWPGEVRIAPPWPDSALWRNELSLVIDQRYAEAEMALIAETLVGVAEPL